MWEEDEEKEAEESSGENLEDGLDEQEAESLEKKAAAKQHADEPDPETLTVTAKEAIRRKLQADMEAFLRRGGAVTQVAADEEAYKKMRETARAPDPSEDD